MRNAWLALAVMLSAAPATAEEISTSDNWAVRDDRHVLVNSGISMPAKAGVVSLVKTEEFSNKGRGIDNVAQYASPDQAIAATVYVYFPSFPDAGLTAYRTSQIIMQRFGPETRLFSASLIDAGGEKAAAIRQLYENADGGTRATAAAFLRAGGWIVKLRVSGPMSRNTDIVATLDALIASLRFEDRAMPTPAHLLEVSECPIQNPRKAKPLKDKDSADAALFGALAGPAVVAGIEGGEAPPIQPLTKVCVRERFSIGPSAFEVMQATDEGVAPTSVFTVINDSGMILRASPRLLGTGHTLLIHQIGQTETLGSYDRIPSGEQLRDILSGTDSKGGAVRSRTEFDPDGSTRINVSSDQLK